MNPTRLRLLAAITGIVGALSWVGFSFWDHVAVLPAVPWTAPIALLALAVAEWSTALTMRARLDPEQHKRQNLRPPSPFTTTRLAALALASSRAAAAVTGAYLGYAAALLPRFSQVPYDRERVFAGLAGAASAAALAWAALTLEKVLRLPPEDIDAAAPRHTKSAPGTSEGAAAT